MTPMRIQRKRTKGWKMPENTVSVTRPGKWGNPFRISSYAREGALEMYQELIENPKYQGQKFKARLADIGELRGKNLACYCHLCEAHKDGRPLGVECQDCDPCHIDILLPLANPEFEKVNQ